jgi:uncharacterized protein YbjQ (UPF0145 family)
MPLYTVETLAGRAIREGDFLIANAVCATNLMRDIREMVTNTFGGKMRRYERLLDTATEQAIAALEAQAAQKGYDGILAVRVAHPSIVDGSAAVVVYGTGFNFVVEASKA